LQEFEATAGVKQNGTNCSSNSFFSRLVAENGKIKLFREALNTFEVAAPMYRIARLVLKKDRWVVTGASHPGRTARGALLEKMAVVGGDRTMENEGSYTALG